MYLIKKYKANLFFLLKKSTLNKIIINFHHLFALNEILVYFASQIFLNIFLFIQLNFSSHHI